MHRIDRLDVKRLTLAGCFLLTSSALPAQDWPQFRGPSGDGVSTAKNLPTRWDRETNVKWRVALPRPANGSPIVSGDHVFLTAPRDEHGKQRALYCFDRKDGKRLFTRTVEFGKVMPTHRTNPYGGSTPATDGKRVVVWHSSAGLYCYDFEGTQLWKREFGEFRHRWGYGTSPVLHDGKVILHSGPGKKVFIAALDLEDGKTIWMTDEPVDGDGQDNAEGRLMGSWCTPAIIDVGGTPQILCGMATRLVAYRPDDGAILWTCGGLPCKKGDLVYSSPNVVGDVCLIRAGYGGPALGVRLGGEGDVTSTHRLWRQPRRPDNVGSGVVVDGYLYTPDAPGTIACVDPKTGKRLWSKRAVKGRVWSSILHADGKLWLMNQRGTTVVFEPNPKELVVLAKNALDEQTNSTPAIAGAEIFLRTHEHLYCIAKAKKKPRADKTPIR